MLTFILQPHSRVNTENPYPILDLCLDLLMLTELRERNAIVSLSPFRFLNVINLETFSDEILLAAD